MKKVKLMRSFSAPILVWGISVNLARGDCDVRVVSASRAPVTVTDRRPVVRGNVEKIKVE